MSLRELVLLDPDVAFLNHGSFDACPRPAFEEYRRLQLELELERRPVDFLARDRRFPELIEAAKARLANYVGADPANLVVVAALRVTGLPGPYWRARGPTKAPSPPP